MESNKSLKQRRPAAVARLPISQRQSQTMDFDSESGQVFTETSVAVRSRQHSDWIGELKTPSLFKPTPPSKKGTRSLFAISTTKASREFRGLTAEHFGSVPWPLARGIWQEIVDSHGESFHTWRALASSYPEPSEFGSPEYRYHLDIRHPSLALDSYFTGITSPESSYLTTLRISPKETRIADLVSLAKISNLTVLDLSDGQHVSEFTQSSSFSERVLRTWSDLALPVPSRQSGLHHSFSHLRVLLLGWQEHLDTWIFQYLPSFPNLTQVILTDCRNIHQKNRKDWEPLASKYGWEARHAKRSAKDMRPHLNEANFPVGAVSGLYYDALKSLAKNTDVARPMLECWIGTPRKWMHILEDFPGTRTVYFDRVRKVPSPFPAPSRQTTPPVSVNAASVGKSYGESKRNRERERDRGGPSSATNSPEPKRALKPKLRTKAAGTGGGGLEELMTEYRR